MFYLLPISQTIDLKEEFKADNIIVLQSATLNLTPGTGIDNTSVYFLSAAKNVLLVVSIRRAQNAVVFNSRTADGPWGTEEKVALEGLFKGPNTTVTIYDHGDRFQILIDYSTVHYYVKRFQENGSAVSYSVNDGQVSLFSDTLAVTTYESFANIIPNGA